MTGPERDASELHELVREYFEACDHDPHLEPEAFARRHPAHRDELVELLSTVRSLRRATETLPWEEDGHGGGPATLDASEQLLARDGEGALELLAGIQEPPPFAARYERSRELARGGQGAVHAVWDTILRRHLAMKVSHQVSSDEGGASPSGTRSLGRFLEEAQVTAQLDHPGIVPVHDLGLDGGQRVCFTMKKVRGRDLLKVFDLVSRGEEGWTQARALGVLLKVCEAMAYAHSKGVIHRDLKPSNVMVGRYGEVYVMDWGLARVRGRRDAHDLRVQVGPEGEASARDDGADDVESPLLTMDGDVLGTPAYMSPEQARGDVAAMGPQADVYAVGAMLYQLLAGHMPYVRRGERPGNRAVWARVLEGPPRSLARAAPGTPAELVAICEKAMARDPAERYADMSELASDLGAFLEGRVVRAHESGAAAELRKWVRRNRGLALTAAAGLLAILVGAITAAVLARREQQRTEEVLRLSAFQRLEDLEREADALWPPWPEHVEAYEKWLIQVRALVAELDPDPAAGTIGHRAQLAELERRALPWTAAEREADRRASPDLVKLEHLELRLEALERADAVRRGEADAEEVALDEETLALDALGLNERAWVHVRPDREAFGQEPAGLAMAREAIEKGGMDQPDLWNTLDTLAWACCANGLDDEALGVADELDRLIRGAEDRGQWTIGDLRGRLQDEIAAAPGRLDALRVDVGALEAEVARRRTWRFPTEQERWWHERLATLVRGIEAFAHPDTGLVTGISTEHGWGVTRRLEWARTIEERSLTGPEPARRWAEAVEAIADAERTPAYGGLVIEPQLGLLPVGSDRESGLWEFVHLMTGEVPERDSDGKIRLTEETGMILVLLPGGTFFMGAQALDPEAPRYSPSSVPNESPVRERRLTPFFLSKYEMTQSQWLRLTGENPSFSQPTRPDFSTSTPVHPVEMISWNDCMACLPRAGLTLPTEARFEYAIRAGTETDWWTGDERESLDGFINLADQSATRSGNRWPASLDWPELDDGYPYTAPVDSFPPNPMGLHNVAGNVGEACLDGWNPQFYKTSPRDDPCYPWQLSDARAVRGAGFYNPVVMARSATRHWMTPFVRIPEYGVRPARDIRGEIGRAGGD